MGFLDIKLSHVTAILSSIIIGVGVDFAIHFIAQYREQLRRGEKITKEPRIRLSTIHAAKGTEATNVILLTDLSKFNLRDWRL